MQPDTQVQGYPKREIILHKGDRLPAKLYAVVSGSIQVTKTATTRKKCLNFELLTIFPVPE
ncbi:hypothetical protein [Nostoc sp.]|uniref:hypothetical protein n=1 Tax=Nostoc sp. TaxID=1180 RepID=UPI002FF4D932